MSSLLTKNVFLSNLLFTKIRTRHVLSLKLISDLCIIYVLRNEKITNKKQHPKNIARTYHPQREDVTQIHNFYYDRVHRLVRLLHYYDKKSHVR